MEENLKAVHKWIMFSFNYPADWIEKAFEGTGLVEHLRDKWRELYPSMNRFYCDFDKDCQKRLAEWVMNNYKG